MSTALVTGASGFIGSHLVEALLERGVRVLGLPGRRALPAGVEAAPLEAAGGVDVVYHVAGVTKALRKEEFRTGNVELTWRVLRAAATAPKFVHVSTLAAADPVSEYGRTKREAERLVAGRAVIVRPPVVYGPRDRDVLEFFRIAVRGWAPRVGRAERRFSVIFVRDLVEGLMLAAEQPAGTFELANDRPVTWTEFGAAAGAVRPLAIPVWAGLAAGLAAEAGARLTGRPSILSRDKIREGSARDWIADTTAAREVLGFRARTPLDEGVAETLGWYREAGWL